MGLLRNDLDNRYCTFGGMFGLGSFSHARKIGKLPNLDTCLSHLSFTRDSMVLHGSYIVIGIDDMRVTRQHAAILNPTDQIEIVGKYQNNLYSERKKDVVLARDLFDDFGSKDGKALEEFYKRESFDRLSPHATVVGVMGAQSGSFFVFR